MLIETSSCNLQFFSKLITTQLRVAHGVTANSCYLSSSPCKATSFNYVEHHQIRNVEHYQIIKLTIYYVTTNLLLGVMLVHRVNRPLIKAFILEKTGIVLSKLQQPVFVKHLNRKNR